MWCIRQILMWLLVLKRAFISSGCVYISVQALRSISVNCLVCIVRHNNLRRRLSSVSNRRREVLARRTRDWPLAGVSLTKIPIRRPILRLWPSIDEFRLCKHWLDSLIEVKCRVFRADNWFAFRQWRNRSIALLFVQWNDPLEFNGLFSVLLEWVDVL